MALDIWFTFVASSSVMLLIPGPTALLVVSYALGQGRRSALATAAGVVLGDFLAMTLSLVGVGALLMASATLFTLVKWIGAAYLVWLGIKLWRAKPSAGDAAPASQTRMFGHAFAVTALNPKSIVFFIAFLPQFIDPAVSLLPQVAILEVTFLALSGLNALFYALVASQAHRAIRSDNVLRTINRAGGSLLIGAGVATAMMRKSA
ncbi:lysine transporter LysE [Agaricicola taiwanensis]|uniref:Lysine transporter LysE n=1 Tax=Agaricicola taiwanensis TaxID=591372 RepID=A0A8J2VKS4_9RHOB|nr:LysE family transporter [Agaricicola taiwanensis]GGE29629.1 lysine transporter LysE [Agaricicola taiwanensis]